MVIYQDRYACTSFNVIESQYEKYTYSYIKLSSFSPHLHVYLPSEIKIQIMHFILKYYTQITNLPNEYEKIDQKY